MPLWILFLNEFILQLRQVMSGEQLGDKTIEGIVWHAKQMIDEQIKDEIESKRPVTHNASGLGGSIPGTIGADKAAK